MPIGHLSIRINTRRRDHHLWLNNGGVYWVHYIREHGESVARRPLVVESMALPAGERPSWLALL